MRLKFSEHSSPMSGMCQFEKGCKFGFRVTISSILHASCVTRLSEVSSIQVTVHTSHRVILSFLKVETLPSPAAGRALQ